MSHTTGLPSPFAPPGVAREISDGIYAYIQPDGSWWINNTGFLVGRKGVTSIDACATERRTRAYLGAIARVTDRPVRTLINTHHHGDHTFGNYLFGTATIVAQDNARAFHNVMQDVQLSRQRNGAYGWSIARDIADPEVWTERYHCPTWFDYLRQRNRPTQSERALHQRAMDFHLGPDPVRVRRMLERPFGSVRWKEDTPDRAANEVLPVATAASGST